MSDPIQRLTVLSPAGVDKFGHKLVRCKCSCGKEVVSSEYRVRMGKTLSCGCLKKEISQGPRFKHNKNWKSYRPPNHPNRGTWVSWQCVKTRCFNPNDATYEKYGAKGITMCDRWRYSFGEFVADLGERPDELSIDRINTKGHYSCGKCDQCQLNGWPMNCRWATDSEQCFNRTISRPITIDGVTKYISQWCVYFGIKRTTVAERERHGMDIISALTKPINKGVQIGPSH